MKNSTTSTTIRYINDNQAQVTKAFAKKAMIFGTEEFKLWREYLAYYPEAKMVPKTIKKKANKKVITKHMTYENMRLYINLQDDSKTVIAEFEKQVKLSKIKENPYRSVLAWFMKKYENINDYKEFFESIQTNEDDEDEFEDEEQALRRISHPLRTLIKEWNMIMKKITVKKAASKVSGYKIDFTTNTLIMNYKFFTASQQYGTPENKLVKSITTDFRNLSISVE